jgi:aminoglycoside phosphotransferase (APT) family kinase protein
VTLTGKRTDIDAVVADLTTWLRRRYDDDTLSVADVVVPTAGFSSETFAFTANRLDGSASAAERLVLRHLPDDPLFLDESLWLQYSMMETAAKGGIRVPALLGFEPDPDALGRPFYLMGHIEGRIPSDRPSHHTQGWLTTLTPPARRQLTADALRTLAAIHRLDWRRFEVLRQRAEATPSLAGYLRWVGRWYRWVAGDRHYPVIEQALDYLSDAPAARMEEVAVLWGDPRLGNLAFTGDLRVEAVLDWEMAALGPPEVDLGWWLMMDWFWSAGVGVDRLQGFPGRSDTIALYEEFLGRQTRDLAYFEICALTRFSIISVRQTDRRIRAGVLAVGTVASPDNPIMRRLALALADPDVLSAPVG